MGGDLVPPKPTYDADGSGRDTYIRRDPVECYGKQNYKANPRIPTRFGARRAPAALPRPAPKLTHRALWQAPPALTCRATGTLGTPATSWRHTTKLAASEEVAARWCRRAIWCRTRLPSRWR